jgi:hypothetical protein
MVTENGILASVDLDVVALKPTEVSIDQASGFDVDAVLIDYEGPTHVPDATVLDTLTANTTIRLTTPIRADGFDPLGNNTVVERLPTSVKRVLVAGHSAYLTEAERRRAIAPRLRAARAHAPNAWIGTEGIERLALAAGGTQFELLSGTTERDLQSLRAAGFEGKLAVYAPVVLTDNEDAILDALGSYVARRQSVMSALSDDTTGESASHSVMADGISTDSTAIGNAREVLLNASHEFALAGSAEQVNVRISELREAGVDIIVGYLACGIEGILN